MARWGTESRKARSSAQNKHVVLGVTASIALYKACDLVRKLKSRGYNVTVVMTEEARVFIKPFLFESLSGNPAYCGLFEGPKAWEIEHVSLADKADVVLIAPATANIIGKLATGIFDDLLTCLVCATKAPVVICPAMNDNMYSHPAVQENIKKLQKRGVTFVEPVKGKLACGKEGVGCLADVEAIVKEVERIL